MKIQEYFENIKWCKDYDWYRRYNLFILIMLKNNSSYYDVESCLHAYCYAIAESSHVYQDREVCYLFDKFNRALDRTKRYLHEFHPKKE